MSPVTARRTSQMSGKFAVVNPRILGVTAHADRRTLGTWTVIASGG